jgi:hypothetical protein
VGGVRGYETFLKAIQDRQHAEHEDYLNWIGGEFNPEAFNLEKVNLQLRCMGRGRSTEALNAWAIGENEQAIKNFALDSAWPQEIPQDQKLIAEELPLRRDVIALLTYLHIYRTEEAAGSSPARST